MSFALTVIPVPAPTARSLVEASVPPPVSPAPAVIEIPLDAAILSTVAESRPSPIPIQPLSVYPSNSSKVEL